MQNTKGQKFSKKKYVVLDSSKKPTLGQFYVLKIAPSFVFWKNPGRHNLLLRFTDLQGSEVDNFMVKKFGVERPGLKIGVEKSGG